MYGTQMRRDTTATTAPYLANSQNPIGYPLRFAIPTTTTFALAPTAVAFPPRSAPRARAHQSTVGSDPGGACATRSDTTGAMVATYGMLSTIAESPAEIHSSNIEA